MRRHSQDQPRVDLARLAPGGWAHGSELDCGAFVVSHIKMIHPGVLQVSRCERSLSDLIKDRPEVQALSLDHALIVESGAWGQDSGLRPLPFSISTHLTASTTPKFVSVPRPLPGTQTVHPSAYRKAPLRSCLGSSDAASCAPDLSSPPCLSYSFPHIRLGESPSFWLLWLKILESFNLIPSFSRTPTNSPVHPPSASFPNISRSDGRISIRF